MLPREVEQVDGQNMLPFPPEELLEYIRKGDKFLIAGHSEPDGDCIGSQLVLASAFKRLGKQAFLCSAGPFRKPEAKAYKHQFLSAPGREEKEGARLIILDCDSLERTGDIAAYLEGLPTAVIDHHGTVSGDKQNFHQKGPVYRVPEAPSTTFLILRLLDALGLEPTGEDAALLFLGLCTDTGFFRHVDERGAATFDMAARLIRLGASPQKTFHVINGGKTFDSRLFMGRVLARAEPHFEGRLIFSSEEYEEFMRFGLENRDSDAVYREFMSISGVEAVAIIRQEKPGLCTLGLRSKDRVDVAKIAKSFGGGGHKNASGANEINGTIAELKLRLLEAFKNEFQA
jgi:phosphoesterase RecJ-like protein